MAKKSTLPPEKRAEVVLRLLSKEEPAAQIARRAGISEQTLYRWREEFLKGGAQALQGRGADREQAKEVKQLKSALAERDQVIGELTTDHCQPRFKKSLGRLELTEAVRRMIRRACAGAKPAVRLSRVLKALGIARQATLRQF